MIEFEAYWAARQRAALRRDDGEGRIGVLGRDRATYLQGLLTNDVLALGAGAGCYATYLTPQGRLIADMRVHELGDALLMDVHVDQLPTLVTRLTDLVFAEDVRIEDWSGRWARISVHGPAAASVVVGALTGGAVWSADLERLVEYHHRSVTVDERTVIVARHDLLGPIGFDLYVAAEMLPDVTDRLEASGTPWLDDAAAEVLRIEGGRPRFPIDMDSETIPLEAGIEARAISLTKGCYVGQEVIVRVLHRGQGRVARRLVGIVFEPAEDDGAGPNAGEALAVEGQVTGRVTSVGFSPALGRWVALGYVRREAAVAGTRVVTGSRQTGVVRTPPLTDPVTAEADAVPPI